MRSVIIAIVVALLIPTGIRAQDVTIASAPQVHGVAFQQGDAPPVVVRAAATSLSIDEANIPPVPEDLGVGENVEEGRYARLDWDKGGYLRDGFSARWTGTLNVEREAEYTFYVTTDDGARLAVDGETIVDVWVPRPPTTSEAKSTLTAGDHEIVMTFFEGGGGAVARLEWSAEQMDRQVIPKERVTAGGQPGWKVEYFRNTEVEGDPVDTTRVDGINIDWGEDGPRIGLEEPGHVGFDWTRVSPTAIVGRINAGPQTQVGVLSQAAGGQGARMAFETHDADILLSEVGGQRFGVKILDPATDFDRNPDDGSFWCPPTEGSVVFLAGFLPVKFMSAAEGRQALRDACLASVNPDLPPYPADDEGWIALFNGDDLKGWKLRRPDASDWEITDHAMDNVGHNGSDIWTESTHLDCDLHIEFKHPKGSNSGVYLQGRYEIQVLDSHDGPTFLGMCGAIYGIHPPSANACRPAGEWNSFDIDFTSAGIDDDGRIVPARMTVRHNDVLIHENAEVPRATGGELDRNYLMPGPILLQGNHGPVTYRNIKIRPK